MDRYNKLNTFLKNKFGERVLKICIDGGFTCPNRDGKCGTGGCIYCGERGSGENTKRIEIKDQVKNFIDSYRGKRANKFVAYFQNFTNTYDSIKNLKEKYDSALIDDRIVALAVATRPDCVDEDVAKLLYTYKERGLYVWVELGLQTTNEKVGKLINRCYTNEDFKKATAILNSYDIDVVTHIMIGLPQEEKDDLKNALDFINAQKIKGIKFHSTYVIKDTMLEKLYKENKYTPITLDDYIEKVLYAITHLRQDIVVHRITGDAPKDLLITPTFCAHKKQVINRVENIMAKDNLLQGMHYTKD